jgi:hypothetical protein
MMATAYTLNAVSMLMRIALPRFTRYVCLI